MELDKDKKYYSEEGRRELIARIEEKEKEISYQLSQYDATYKRVGHEGGAESFSFIEKKRVVVMLQTELLDLKANLNNYILLEAHNNPENADMGDDVEIILDDGTGFKERFVINVSGVYAPKISEEEHIISLNSPIGRAVYNKPIGYSTKLPINGGKTSIEIVGIKKSMEISNNEEQNIAPQR